MEYFLLAVLWAIFLWGTMRQIHKHQPEETHSDLGPSPSTVASLITRYNTPLRLIAVVVILLIWFRPEVWAGRQMLLHILLMTALAPAIALVLVHSHAHQGNMKPSRLWVSMALQAIVFLFWHTPYGMSIAHQTIAGEVNLQVSLLIAATLFWWSLLRLHQDKSWHAILALLVTGKLFCLVALLMTFSPRALYPAMSLVDQQFAGAIMITLCPLCYVVSAIWLCSQWLIAAEQRDLQLPQPPSTARGQCN